MGSLIVLEEILIFFQIWFKIEKNNINDINFCFPNEVELDV